MKNIYVLTVLAFLVSCSSAAKQESREQMQNDTIETVNEVDATTPDFEIGLQFIDEYIEHISASADLEKTGEWVQNHPLLTQNFKDTYKKIVEEANRKDPEMGLNYDPIIKGQDFPETGFFYRRKKC